MNLSDDLKQFLDVSASCVCICSKNNSNQIIIAYLNKEFLNKFSNGIDIKLPIPLIEIAPDIIDSEIEKTVLDVLKNKNEVELSKSISSTNYGALLISYKVFYLNGFVAITFPNISELTNAKEHQSVSLSLHEDIYKAANMYSFEVDMITKEIKTEWDLIGTFDLDKSKANVSFDDYLKQLAPDDLVESIKNYKTISENPSAFHSERKIITPKGNTKFIEVFAKPILENGKFIKLIGTVRDITKKKLEAEASKDTEQKLIENARFIKYAHEYLEMGTYTVDLNTNQIITEYDFTKLLEEETLPNPFTLDILSTYLEEEDSIDARHSINEAIQNGKSYSRERKLITAKGNIKYLEVNVLPLIENGKCSKLFSVFRDITRKKKAELKIFETEQKLINKDQTIKVAHDILKIGTYELDLRTNIAIVNENITKMLELDNSIEELTLDFYIKHLVLEKGERSVLEIMQESIANNTSYIISRKVKTNTGNIIYVENAGQPIYDNNGNPLKLVGTFRDITKEKLAEEELIRNSKLIEFAHNNMNMGTYIIDLKTGMLETDYDFAAMLEMPEKKNKFPASDLELYSDKEDYEHSMNKALEMIETKQPYTYTRKFITTTGKNIYLEVNVVPIFDDKNNVEKVFGIFRNITEKREQELKLIAAENELKENARIVNYAHENLLMGTYNFNLTTQLIETDFNYIDFFDLSQNHEVLHVEEYLSFLSDFDKKDTLISVENVITNNIVCTKERKVITQKGEIKYLEVTAQALYENNQCNNIIGTFRDVTNKKLQELKLLEADKALKQKDELLKNAHQLLTMGTYEIDFENEIISSELDLISMFELPETSFPLKLSEYRKLLSAQDLNVFDNDLYNAEQHKIKYTSERKLITPKGKTKYIEILGIPIFDEHSKLIKIQGTIRDITERKTKEERLKITEQKLSETVKMLEIAHEQLRMGSYMVDLSTKEIVSTLDVKELYELPDEKNDFTLEDYFKYISKDELDESKLIFKKLIESGISFSRERKITTAKGNEKFVEITGNPFYENGRITKITGTFRDISFRKKLEIKLLNTEIKLLEAESLLRMGTFDFDLVNNKIEHSIELSKLLELPEFKTINSVEEFVSFVHDDDKIKTAQYIQGLINGENLNDTVQRKMISQKGNIKYFEIVSKITSVNNQPIRLSGTFRDITEQYEKDIALKRSEEKFRELFENTPSMYFIIDTNYIVNSVNQFGADYLGYKKNEIVGKNIRELFYTDDKPLATKNLEHLITTDSMFSQWEIRKRKKSGEIIWVKETARIIKSTDDNLFFLIVCEDITAEIQNRLLVSRKQDELQKAKEKAEVAMYEKQQFTSIMSHEIRTPLNAVIGMTNVLLMENPRENQIAELNTLKFAAENLLVLVNDILDFSKIESGKIQLEKISFDIHKLVHNIKSSYKFKADEKGIFINCLIDEDVPSIIIGDPMRISQILNNLVSNAVKFTEQGFVEISLRNVIHMIDGEIKIRFEISDTGIGIPTSKLKTIFESFSQANIDTTRKYGGTGLGLTITQKLIHLYKSEIDLQSEVGKGSTFSFDIVFLLPKKDNIDKSSFFISERSASSEIKKVLLVEDNEINRIVTVKFLKRWNLDVDTAINGKDAINKLESSHFDLVLMDIHMPEMNGVEATKIIRNHTNLDLKNIPIIALTAAAVDNERETLIEEGLSDYISKPFNPAELHDKIFKYFSN
jgi:PAS domain S-box-containing protein